ncbi:MAG: hypothetical protein SFY69_06840 [Planctomycetota bacterium]|nr:hypothetical protein [Planctomycetota bacterium]
MPEPARSSPSARAKWAWLLVALLGWMPAARAQVAPADVPTPAAPAPPAEAFPAPEVSDAVTRLLEQPYLREDERRLLRIRHGVWEDADLQTPADHARAALVRGALRSPALDDEQAPALDRAEAHLRRGNPARALELLDGAEAPQGPAAARAARLRGEALADLGRFDDAIAALTPLAGMLANARDADEAGDAAMGLLLLARLVGPADERAMKYQPMLDALGRARETLNRLAWSVPLAEAMLLYEKDRYAEVGPAIENTLTLNPRCAAAWSLLGRAAVDSFDFPRAEAIALRLDELAGEATIDGAIIRSMVEVRRGEGAAAERALEGARGAFPDSRAVRAQWAAAAAARFDFAAADARLAELDALAPGTPVGQLAVGRAMASARQYEEAARYLRAAAERAPRWAEPVIELGLSELQAGRDAQALDALERGATMDQYNVRAANSLTLLRELRSYLRFESEHFVVRCRPGQDEILAREMLAQLEKIFARVTGDGPGGIRHAPNHKTVVELYPDHRWFSVRIAGLPQLHTIAAATGPVIAMEAPRTGPGHKVGTYDWARVVQHEYVHTVTLSRTKNRLPHWFTEASAVYLEDAPRGYSTVQLLARAVETGTLFDLDSINVGFVRPRRPSDRALAYAQGHWMYEYIIERWGNEAPLQLMDLYAAGVREPEAFRTVLQTSREDFLAGFTDWAREQLVAWGMSATDERPGILTLLSRSGADEPSPPLIAEWLSSHPDNPFVLELALEQATKDAPADVPALCERYAKARPVDPLPHKLLAALYLSGQDAPAGKSPLDAIPHLEYLDAREQSSPGYAAEIARLYATKKEFPRALASAARATQIAPYDATIREFAATIALMANDLDAAERHLRALTILEPDRTAHQRRLDALLARRASPAP